MVVLTHAVLFAPAVVAVVFCFVCISNCHLPGEGQENGERREGEGGLLLLFQPLLCIW